MLKERQINVTQERQSVQDFGCIGTVQLGFQDFDAGTVSE